MKRGGRYHPVYCAGFTSLAEARVRGRIYDLAVGYPALWVPQEDVLLRGTADRVSDLASSVAVEGPSDEGPWVHGEVLEFEDDERRLRALDHLEGFTGSGSGDLYLRVVVPVWLETGPPVAAWTYVWPGLPVGGRLLPDGRWEAS